MEPTTPPDGQLIIAEPAGPRPLTTDDPDYAPYLFSLAQEADLWVDANTVVHRFSKVPWLPPTFTAMLAVHRIDAEALTELSEDDLRQSFFITETQAMAKVLGFIDALYRFTFLRTNPSFVEGGVVVASNMDNNNERHMDEEEVDPATHSPEVTEAEEAMLADHLGMDREALAEYLAVENSTQMGGGDCGFVEGALRPLQESWDEERTLRRRKEGKV